MNNGTEQAPQEVRLLVTLPHAQLILNALTERPHREVAQLIPNLMAQIQEQLRPQRSAEEIEERNAVLKAGLKPID